MENIQAIQDFLIKFPIFPYLWVPHCIMSSLALRQVYGEKACDIAKTNPLSCFIRLCEEIRLAINDILINFAAKLVFLRVVIR